MKKTRGPGLMLLLCLPLMTLCQSKQVMIRIIQDHAISLDKYETNITLQKKAFKIQVFLENVQGVYAFSAFSDSLCCRLAELDPIEGFTDLPDRTMTEPDFNREKELLVNDDNSCAYWYYDPSITWKGFNRKVHFIDTNKVVAIKSIKQLYYVPDQQEIKLKDINTPLYLFFVAIGEFDDKGKPLKELMRKKVRIDWVDED